MIDDKSIMAITLARGGSKGIPKKNLAVINGKSLLERAIECGKSKLVDLHYVSSDCEEILAEAERLGAKTIFRPKELASDTASSAAAIDHVLSEIGYACYIVEIMCTSPFKSSKDVEAVIHKLHTTQCDSVVGVVRILDHHPARVKYIEDDILKDFFPEKKESRRQDLEPHAYVRNGSLYAFTYEAFQKYKSRYGGIVKPYIMTETQSINIDEPHDLLLAQMIGQRDNL